MCKIVPPAKARPATVDLERVLGSACCQIVRVILSPVSGVIINKVRIDADAIWITHGKHGPEGWGHVGGHRELHYRQRIDASFGAFKFIGTLRCKRP